METSKEVLFFFSALGAFNGLILSCYLFFFTKKKRLSNYFLAMLLLALSLRITKSVFLFFNPNLPKIYLQIGLSACFIIGPALFYFVKSSLKETNTLPKKWKRDFTILIIIISLVGVIFPYATYPKFWNLYFVKVIYLQWFIYIILTAFTLKSILVRIFSKDINTFEKWLLCIFGANSIIFASYVLSLLTAYSPAYISGSLSFTFFLYVFIFTFLHRRKADTLFSLYQDKYVNKKVENEKSKLLIEKIKQLMFEKKLFQNANLSINELSKEMGISGHQLSQLLNDNIGKSFATFVNEYRIDEACKIINSDNNFTLEGIGYEVGFNSKTTFFTTFKKIKGKTPAFFQKNGDN